MVQSIVTRILQSSFARLCLMGGLILVLQAPALRISSLIREREQNRHAAITEVQQTWGGPRTIQGPVLIVPRRREEGWVQPDGESLAIEHEPFVIRPLSLKIDANLSTHVRRRGFFEVPLYDLRLQIDATFAAPTRSDSASNRTTSWGEAVLALPIMGRFDSGVPESALINGTPTELVAAEYDNFVTVSLSDVGLSRWVEDADAPPVRVSYESVLRGADRLFFSPAVRTTDVGLSATWPDPKFSGAFLPSEREVTQDGFRASWQLRQPGVSRFEALASHQASMHRENTAAGAGSSTAVFGVELNEPVDAYRMSRRSLKYEFLFTTLTLMVFFLVEVFGRRRLHPVPYLLIGLALVMFYLLILALSEHVSFKIAYLLSALGVVGLVTGYSFAVIKDLGAARLVGLAMCALYGFLYVLLALVDYSLLIGSLGLFAILTAVMFLTRNIEWGDLETAPEGPS